MKSQFTMHIIIQNLDTVILTLYLCDNKECMFFEALNFILNNTVCDIFLACGFIYFPQNTFENQ